MNKLIVIEGIDCSGKTTIAKRLAEDLGWRFEHEPTFSSQEADSLNFGTMNPWQREFYFLKDRIKHQPILFENNCILDSYILRGIVYASTFSKEPLKGWIVQMCQSIYSLKDFKQPNLIIYIDQCPHYAAELNRKRRLTQDFNPKLDINKLIDLSSAYRKYLPSFSNTILVNPIKGDINGTYNLVKIYVDSFLNTFPERMESNENKGDGSVS